MKTFHTKKIGGFAFILAFILNVPTELNAQTWSISPPKRIGPPISIPIPPSPPASYPIPKELIDQGICHTDGQVSKGRLVTLIKPRIENAIHESHEILNDIGHIEAALDRKHVNKPEPRNALNAIGALKNRTEVLLKKLKEMDDGPPLKCSEVILFLQEAREITKHAEREVPSRLDAVEERIRDALKKEKVERFPRTERYITWVEWETNPFCFWFQSQPMRETL
ncbi:MAG: hypothetical protein HY559_04400 [Gammaproteobacteria bacterium]|nr:hypothetical protein [Gammaproteobacteria bacterium]